MSMRPASKYQTKTFINSGSGGTRHTQNGTIHCCPANDISQFREEPHNCTAYYLAGSKLRPTLARRNHHVPLQDPDRAHAAGSPVRGATGRSPCRLFRDPPDDSTRDAALTA